MAQPTISIESLEARRLLSVAYDWSVGGGCSGVAAADAVAVGADGSVYVLGHFSGSMDVDPSPAQFVLTATGSRDLFVNKYSTDGKLVWARAAGGPDGQFFPTSISTDTNGFLYIVGSFTGSVILTPGQKTFRGTSNGGEDAFIVQLNQDS